MLPLNSSGLELFCIRIDGLSGFSEQHTNVCASTPLMWRLSVCGCLPLHSTSLCRCCSCQVV